MYRLLVNLKTFCYHKLLRSRRLPEPTIETFMSTTSLDIFILLTNIAISLKIITAICPNFHSAIMELNLASAFLTFLATSLYSSSPSLMSPVFSSTLFIASIILINILESSLATLLYSAFSPSSFFISSTSSLFISPRTLTLSSSDLIFLSLRISVTCSRAFSQKALVEVENLLKPFLSLIWV